jgi:xanthine dehydrogenase accessory factor
MHLGLENLLDFYRQHRDDDALVLGTIIGTEGSTYRKTGAMMLIAEDGSHRGLISGGCLEADLAQHASSVFKQNEARIVSYDLSAGEDLIWGLGIGCEGVIHLLLQRLDRAQGFGFLQVLDRSWQQRRPGLLTLVIESANTNYPLGSFSLDAGEASAGKLPDSGKKLQPSDSSRRFWIDEIATEQGKLLCLKLPLRPPPTLLICGAGVDALPVAQLAIQIGWDCSIVDHRSGFADPARFPAVCAVQQLKPETLGQAINLNQTDAVIIMSHNLIHDRAYLAQVLSADISYIGLLGPRTRRDRLLDEIGVEPANAPHIHGPAGLDIGSELPESIALSIIAEIHACLNERHGGELTPAGE